LKEDDFEKKASIYSDGDDNADNSLSFLHQKLPSKLSNVKEQTNNTDSPNDKIEEFAGLFPQM
jgi:hypothetical protein